MLRPFLVAINQTALSGRLGIGVGVVAEFLRRTADTACRGAGHGGLAASGPVPDVPQTLGVPRKEKGRLAGYVAPCGLSAVVSSLSCMAIEQCVISFFTLY